ncbi:MAG: peptidoglycan DD-metalloendopeptidase family protein, partial [Gammaproteobacteria bacterium]|nr:peptidoglycan DD-metalloendopeptidase family protein [Gammaproteobacteria bacterium]
FNLKHYHGLIIIKHTEDVFSVYGNNKEILVAEKEHVVAGQEIARLSDAPDDTKLYFEVRQGGRPLKALNYLPKLKISHR